MGFSPDDNTTKLTHSYKFSALGTPAKPPRDVPRNALLCSFTCMEGFSRNRGGVFTYREGLKYIFVH